VQRGLGELAEVCERGRKSGWPSRDPWRNGEAWQNTYVALATRILDGRVDVDRPLGPLARLAARRFFLSERRGQQRLTELTDTQLHRFHLGEERTLEEEAESARRGDALRVALIDQLDAGNLSEADLAILTRRYVDEWGAAEVADAMGLGIANVRQICTRRCQLLREALAAQGLPATA
jgi:DNA-directed RNA polymerase specialized sigma24 family protein